MNEYHLSPSKKTWSQSMSSSGKFTKDPLTDTNILHVYPIGDLKEHDKKGTKCWCQPDVEYIGDGALVTHNSADGREAYETGRRKRH
jgi:hypothetical protein